MRIVYKLGGSVITDKERERSVKLDVIRSILSEISDTAAAIVHGGGSFGHPLAKKYGVNFRRVGPKEAVQVMMAMDDLSSIVLREALAIGIRGILLRPRNFVINEGGRIKEAYWKIFTKYSEAGAVPITHGDVVFDEILGFSICSGDDLMAGICRELRPDLAMFLTDVSGIFDKDPKEYENAKLIREISLRELEKIHMSYSKKDATGGMARKIKAICKIAEICPVYVLRGEDLDNLRRAISGRDFLGTKVFKNRREEEGTYKDWDIR